MAKGPFEGGHVGGPFDETKHKRGKGGKFADENLMKSAASLTTKRSPGKVPGVSGADRLRDAFNAGHKVGERLKGGIVAAETRRVTLSDGTEAVLKSHLGPGSFDPGGARERVVKEVLAGHVANLLGLNDVSTVGVDTAGRDGLHTLTHFVEGKSGKEYTDDLNKKLGVLPLDPHYLWRDDQPAREAADKQSLAAAVQEPNGREIGVLDWLIANQDRSRQNWIRKPDGRLIPIDHGGARFDPRVGSNGESPFEEHWVGAGRHGKIARKPKVSQQYLAGVRQVLESHKQDFAGRPKYYDAMMERLAMLEAKAPKTIPGEKPFPGTSGAAKLRDAFNAGYTEHE